MKMSRNAILCAILHLLLTATERNSNRSITSTHLSNDIQTNLIKLGVILIVTCSGFGVALYLHGRRLPHTNVYESSRKLYSTATKLAHSCRVLTSGIISSIRTTSPIAVWRNLSQQMNIGIKLQRLTLYFEGNTEKRFCLNTREIKIIRLFRRKENPVENSRNDCFVKMIELKRNLNVKESKKSNKPLTRRLGSGDFVGYSSTDSSFSSAFLARTDLPKLICVNENNTIGNTEPAIQIDKKELLQKHKDKMSINGSCPSNSHPCPSNSHNSDGSKIQSSFEVSKLLTKEDKSDTSLDFVSSFEIIQGKKLTKIEQNIKSSFGSNNHSLSSSFYNESNEKNPYVIFYIGSSSTSEEEDYNKYNNPDNLEHLTYYDPPNIPDHISYPFLEKEMSKHVIAESKPCQPAWNRQSTSGNQADYNHILPMPRNSSYKSVTSSCKSNLMETKGIWNFNEGVPVANLLTPTQTLPNNSLFDFVDSRFNSPQIEANLSNTHNNPHQQTIHDEKNTPFDFSHHFQLPMCSKSPPPTKRKKESTGAQTELQKSGSSFNFDDPRFHSREENNTLCDFSHLLQFPIYNETIQSQRAETSRVFDNIHQQSVKSDSSFNFDDPRFKSPLPHQQLVSTTCQHEKPTIIYDQDLKEENVVFNIDQMLDTSTDSNSTQYRPRNRPTQANVLKMPVRRDSYIVNNLERKTIFDAPSIPYYGYCLTRANPANNTSHENVDRFQPVVDRQFSARVTRENQPYRNVPLYARTNDNLQFDFDIDN